MKVIGVDIILKLGNIVEVGPRITSPGLAYNAITVGALITITQVVIMMMISYVTIVAGKIPMKI